MIEVDVEGRKSREWQEYKGEKVKAAVIEIFMSQHTHQLKSQSDTATEEQHLINADWDAVHSVYPNDILLSGMDTFLPHVMMAQN